MKLILQEYGLTLLAVLVSGALLVLCMNDNSRNPDATKKNGILAQALYARNRQTGKDHMVQADRQACSSHMSQEAPLIVCHTYGIKRGQCIEWNRIFDARDNQGRIVPIAVISVNGQEVKDGFYFERIGKYQVVVEAVDATGKRSRQLFQLPVLPQTGMQEGDGK